MAFKYTFQHFMDVSTSASSVNIIKIKAGGEYVRQRCKHLFSTYKYFKLGRISVKLIPASTLPVDPIGLSYSDEDPNGVDPRDQLSPGLVRITNGEPIDTDLTGLSDDQIRQMYTNTMLDPRWSKFMLQSGFKRSAVPLAYDVGNLKQTVYPNAVRNLPATKEIVTGTVRVGNTIVDNSGFDASNSPIHNYFIGSDGRGLFQLGHKKRIGWLSTDDYERFVYEDDDQLNAKKLPLLTPIPEIDCITVIFPKAYKTRYYYRLFVTETVFFSGVKNVGIGVTDESGFYEYRAFDNFSFSDYPRAFKPSVGQSNITNNPDPPNDGRSNV